MGHVELRDDRIVFVFPEHLDASGEPRRIRWGEAAETDLILDRLERADLPVALPVVPPA